MPDAGYFENCAIVRGNMNGAAGVKWTICDLATATADLPLITTAGAGDRSVGVLIDNYAENSTAAIATSGVGKIICDGATNNIAINDWIKAGASGNGVLAMAGDPAIGIALEPLTADDTAINVLICPGPASYFPSSETATTATETITIADLRTGYHTIDCTANGAVALAIPAAASVRAGTKLRVLKTGTAGAVTITPTSGTISAGATHAAIDADNDFAIFEADPVGTNWFIDFSIIA